MDSALQEPLLERISGSPEPEADASKTIQSNKRKRNQDEEHAPKNTAKKATKKTNNKKAKLIENDDLDVESGINKAFSHMDNQLLADYVAQGTRKYESDLSTIELEDKYLPGENYVGIMCRPFSNITIF